MASANRNQHWVPQFYLRYFATPETRDTRHLKIWHSRLKKARNLSPVFEMLPQNVIFTRFAILKLISGFPVWKARSVGIWPKLTRDRYPIDLGFKRTVTCSFATLYLRHPSELCRQSSNGCPL